MSVDFKKVFRSASGPMKTIAIIWGFLILIISFIYFIFFDPIGALYSLRKYPLAFDFIAAGFAGLLFLYWLLVWNTLIKAFFKEDLAYYKKNGLKLDEVDG